EVAGRFGDGELAFGGRRRRRRDRERRQVGDRARRGARIGDAVTRGGSGAAAPAPENLRAEGLIDVIGWRNERERERRVVRDAPAQRPATARGQGRRADADAIRVQDADAAPARRAALLDDDRRAPAARRPGPDEHLLRTRERDERKAKRRQRRLRPVTGE